MDDDVKQSFIRGQLTLRVEQNSFVLFFSLVVAECFYVSRNVFPDFVGSEEYFVYEISEEMFYPSLLRFVWRRHGAHLDGHQHGGRKPTEKHLLARFAKKA